VALSRWLDTFLNCVSLMGVAELERQKRVVSMVIIILEKKKLLGVDESSLRNHALPRV
jgi:hypothetical protein